MTTAKDTQDPSMDEILSSIRQLIATESKRKPPSVPKKTSEDILDLTNLLPDEACSAARPKEKKEEEPASKKGMRLPAWAENIKMPFPTEAQKTGHSRKEDLFLSRAAAEETARAIHNLTQAVRQQDTSFSLPSSPLKEVDNQALERQVRELLRPLLKEWLDTNLPVLVKWIVNEQIEKLMHQYGLFSASKK